MARWREVAGAPGRSSPSRVESERAVFDAMKAEHDQDVWPLIDAYGDLRDVLVGPRERERLWERRAGG